MKDMVSLMRRTNRITDCMSKISFSAVFMEDKNLGELCLELDNEFKKTRDELYRTIFSLRGVKKDELITITDMMEIESDLVDSFSDRAQLILDKKPLHPVVKKVIDEEQKRTFVIKTSKSSFLNGKSLLELRLEQKTGATILAIRRDEKWIVELEPKQKIKHEDALVCFGDEKAVNLLRKASKGKLKI